MKALCSLVALLVAACSYDFGGGAAGGASASASGTGGASTSSGPQDTQASASTTAATTAAESVTSSSTGEAPLSPCALSDGSMPFREDFGMGAMGRWQKANDGAGSDARVDMEEALLDLGDNDIITYMSKREISFVDCYVIVEETEGTNEELEIVMLRDPSEPSNAFYLSYQANNSDQPEMVADVTTDGVPTGAQPLKRTRVPWRRFEARGDRVRAAIGADGTQWDVIFDGPRAEWMDGPSILIFELQSASMSGSGDARFDNVNPL